MACEIDHSKKDVRNKLESQKEFLPTDLYSKVANLLETIESQEILNEVFHLLKKYDLADEREKQKRNKALEKIVAYEK